MIYAPSKNLQGGLKGSLTVLHPVVEPQFGLTFGLCPANIVEAHPLDALCPPHGAADARPPGECVALLEHVDGLNEHGQVEAQHERDGRVEEHLR